MLGTQGGFFGQIGAIRPLADPNDPRRLVGPRPMGPAAPGMPGFEVAYQAFPAGLRPITTVIPAALPGDAPVVRLGSGNSGPALLGLPASTAVTDPYGDILGYRPGSRVGRLVQLQRQGQMLGRPPQTAVDPVVELLGDEFATPEDLQRYDRGGTTRGSWEFAAGDPFDTAKNSKGTRPYAEFTTVDVPARLPDGAWRDASGRVNTMRIDPTRQVATVTLNPDATFASDREKSVSFGQLAEALMDEYKTPAIGPEALAAAQQSGRFLPAVNAEPGQPIGVLRRLTSAAEPGERSLAVPASSIAPLQEAPRRQMRYEGVPVFEAKNRKGETIYRLGSSLPRNYESIRSALVEALPPGSSGQVPLDPVAALQGSRRNQYITPRRLQEGIAKGFQVSEVNPETGVMAFTRPDGSSGFLVPEKVLAAGDVVTDVNTGRYIVATPEMMERTQRSYGPGPLLPGGAERSWQAKQRDLGGMELSTFLGEVRQGGQSEGPQRLTDTARLVAQIAQQRGIPLAALARTGTTMPGPIPATSTRLQELRDAAQLLSNQAAVPVQGVIPGLPSTREMRSARFGSPQSRRQERLYTAPSTPLPVAAVAYDQPALFALPQETYVSTPVVREPVTFAALAQDIDTGAGGNLGLSVTNAEPLPVTGLAPRQTWIPGIPSSPAELAVPLSAEQQRYLAYMERAGRQAQLEEVARTAYAEPAPRTRQAMIPGIRGFLRR
jgi:hypothetical protein